MKLNAVGITTRNMADTKKFYSLLGFNFPDSPPEEDHVEAITEVGSARLMIDKVELIEKVMGEKPKPSNHSAFAVEFDKPEDVDTVVAKIKEGGYEVFKNPWNAFWGQRYAIVKDPDGYLIDLYSNIPT